uniref:Flotillin family protein n=1 Tax=Roseihalotalea indica TaxID=2867963 RepID=A0AA49GLJ6_9BACT|nr:flotillin family protein [Tunicatimonas sp. TK19036]
MEGSIALFVGIILIVLLFAIGVAIIKMYNKASQGQALIVTGGTGGAKVSFSGLMVVPVLHRLEVMDITVKTIMISRTGKDGLICKDNLRADIQVTFFSRVNKTKEDVIHVAQSIGCDRASDPKQLEILFDAKFSEALKTVGKHFEFVELYNSRAKFKDKILEEIGTDLNGYILDDCAIDYLEQTPLEYLNEDNILDSEGIKKIIDLTAQQKIQSNLIENEKRKTIKKQDVEAEETILQLEKQLTEQRERQESEVTNIRSRENAEREKVRQEEHKRSEEARIRTEEEIGVAEQNKERQILVAQRNKERTDAIEIERVAQAKALEATERERVVELARIEKEKSLEEERKNIQEVIRERVMVEKATVEEEEKIKDTRAKAEADRNKEVALINAEKEAQESLVKEIKAAEAAKQASEHRSKQIMIDAQAEEESAEHRAKAMKIMADAEAAQNAAIGLSEAQVMEAKAAAREKEGEAEAGVIEAQAEAEAQGIRLRAEAQSEADHKIGMVAAQVSKEQGKADAEVVEIKATADEKQGMAEARVMQEKYKAEAEGIRDKANAMQVLDGPGKDHEEFKLRLETEKALELAKINIQKDIAEAQAQVISEALKASNIEIIGGETMLFDQIMGSIAKGKAIDGMVRKNTTLLDIKDTFFHTNGGGAFKDNLKKFISQFGVSAEDMKNLTVSALLFKLMNQTDQPGTKDSLTKLMDIARSTGLADEPVKNIKL